MKKLFAILFASAALLTSCNPEPIHPVDVVDAPAFIAVIDSPMAGSKASWDAADEISVCGTGTAVFKAKSAGERSDMESVSGDAGNGPFTAYYPAGLQDNMVLPALREYDSEGAAVSPMVAVSSNKVLPFKCIFGKLSFNLYSDEEIIVKTLSISADKPLSGAYTISDGKAVLEGTEGVVIDCGDGVAVGSEGTPFCLELPEGRYDNLNVYILDNLGRERVLDLGMRAVTLECGKQYDYRVDMGNIHQKRATIISGREFNMFIKGVAAGKAVDSVEFADKKIKIIEFDVNSEVSSGTEIQAKDSDYPVYVNFDSSILTISTPAPEIYTGKDASYMFAYLIRTDEITGLEALNTEFAKNMSNMFCQGTGTAVQFDTLVVSKLDTRNVENMDSMFFNMRTITTLDLSNFDTHNCKSMSHMFDQCPKLTAITFGPGFNTAAVEDMSYMFNSCGRLLTLDLSTFDTSSARDMNHMFAEDLKLGPLDFKAFKTGNVTNMSNMFLNCRALTSLDLSNFDTSCVTDMSSMFYGCSGLKELNVSKFSTSNVEMMTSMFRGCSSLASLDLTSFNTTVLNPNADYMFYQMASLSTLTLGDTFLINTTPSYFTAASDNAQSARTANIPGALTIFCNQSVADWIATTNFRWINSGYNGKTAIPITFKDRETGAIINVTWSAN